MNKTKPSRSKNNQVMEVINKPRIDYTRKSLQFFFGDWRKIVSGIVVLTIPVLNNLWRFFPEYMSHSYYGTFQSYVWTVCIHIVVLALGVAWFFSVPEKDKVLRSITLSVIFYATLLTYQSLEFGEGTPLWLDISASAVIFAGLYFCLQYIQKNYLDKPNDYKALHDGLVYDLHHQRFLGSINRIAGLLEIAEIDEPYKCLCSQEINELKESIAYIAEKYETLN